MYLGINTHLNKSITIILDKSTRKKETNFPIAIYYLNIVASRQMIMFYLFSRKLKFGCEAIVDSITSNISSSSSSCGRSLEFLLTSEFVGLRVRIRGLTVRCCLIHETYLKVHTCRLSTRWIWLHEQYNCYYIETTSLLECSLECRLAFRPGLSELRSSESRAKRRRISSRSFRRCKKRNLEYYYSWVHYKSSLVYVNMTRKVCNSRNKCYAIALQELCGAHVQSKVTFKSQVLCKLFYHLKLVFKWLK